MTAVFEESDNELRRLLAATKTIAVIGAKEDPSEDAHRVPLYMQRAGYRILPVNPKLDRALWGLQAKLTNGNYTHGAVKVRNGWVEVFVHVTELTDDTLAKLKKLGVRVVTEVHSKKLVVAKVRVADLERIAALRVVNRVVPPKF